MVHALAAVDLPDSGAAGVVDDSVLRGIYFSGGGGAGDCGAAAQSSDASAMVDGGASCKVDCDFRRGLACGSGGLASICAVASSREA